MPITNIKEATSDTKNIEDMKRETRKLKIMQFLVSYKFIIAVYILMFIFGILIWVVAGVVEEVSYNASTDPNKQRIFVSDGGIFVFDRGCAMTNNTTIIIGVEAILYIILEFICLVICFFADKDTWGIKRETMILIVFQIVLAIAFIIAGNLSIVASM